MPCICLGQIKKFHLGEGSLLRKWLCPVYWWDNFIHPIIETTLNHQHLKIMGGGGGGSKLNNLLKEGGTCYFLAWEGVLANFFLILVKHFSLALSPSLHNNGPVTFSCLVTFDRNPRVRNPFW